VKRYSLVNDETGVEHDVELDPVDAEDSRWFWKSIGWTLIEVKRECGNGSRSDVLGG